MQTVKAAIINIQQQQHQITTNWYHIFYAGEFLFNFKQKKIKRISNAKEILK